MTRRWLAPLLILQGFTHLVWLSPSAHSGQAAIPWMMNRGLRLFGEIWEQHAPGASLLGAAAQSLLPFIEMALLLKLLNTALVLALTLLIYQLAKRLSGGEAAGLLAALVWAWWVPVYGNVMLYFDTLLGLCVMLALLIGCGQSGNLSRRQLIAMGLAMGAATLFKQHAWLALAIMALWLLTRAGRRGLLIYLAAALALPLLQWLILAAQGLLEGYIYWNWTFNLAGTMDGEPLDGDLFRKLLLSNLLVFPVLLGALRGGDGRLRLLMLMWLAALALLYPRFGEIHAMAHLPFTAVMSGLTLHWIAGGLTSWRSWDRTRMTLAGLALGIGLGWLWTGAVSYIPTPVGPGAALAHDEFAELVARWQPQIQPGDTLFILPQTDSTPQLHPMTGLPPPGRWIKGWRWYFRPDFVLETLTAEWQADPPTWIAVFPDLIEAGGPGILALLDIVDADYALQFTSGDIYHHGSAQIYRLPG